MSAALPPSSNLFDCRDAFAAALDQVAERDNRIVIVVNDSIGSSKLGGFRKRWPERTINVGIAEQNMVGVGSGLANGGKVPFVSAAACFLTARALEQIKADVAYTNANVKLVGQSPGVGYGELGPTHHSIEDMAWLNSCPVSRWSRPPIPGRPLRPWRQLQHMRGRCSSASADLAFRSCRAPTTPGSKLAKPRRFVKGATSPSSLAGSWSHGRWRLPTVSLRAA